MLRVLVSIALASSTALADATEPYVVQPGDSCIGIALRVIGDRAAVAQLHRLNPQLGPLPHTLVAGTVLQLPSFERGPDAHVTRSTGDVKFRKPSTAQWDAARRGLELYRAYRVGAAARSSAELTFADDAHLGMREKTIVVIYGPEKRLAKVLLATAELERGTLESRLGELDGKTVVVRTNAGETRLRSSEVVVAAKPAGPSIVSHHRGAEIELSGRTRTRTAVKLVAGTGTRVFPGRAPEPPRPLPVTPVWITPSGPRMIGVQGTITLAWNAVPRAAEYRVALRDAGGDLVRELAIVAPASSVALPLAGAYSATVSAFDADGLESAPSASLAIETVALTFVSPFGRRPGPGATTPRSVAVGTTLIAPAGTTCTIGGPSASKILFDRAGTRRIVCRSAKGESDPLALEVVPLHPPAKTR